MGTTRVRHEHSQDVQGEIIFALKNNVGDYFTSAEIAETIGRDDIQTQHVASILKVMVREGTAHKSRDRGNNLYCLRPEALLWKPAPYDWRVSKGIGQTTAQSVVPPATQDTQMFAIDTPPPDAANLVIDHFRDATKLVENDITQDTGVNWPSAFIPVPPPPGIPALSIDQKPLHSASLAMAPDILGTEPPPVPISYEDESPPPTFTPLPEVIPVETKKECRCTRVAKLPPLPHGWVITSIKLVIEDIEDHGTGFGGNMPRITISTVDEGYLDWKAKGTWSMNPGDMAQVSAVGDALLQLHIESQSHD